MDAPRGATRVPLACAKCTRRCAASAKFCPNCGAKLHPLRRDNGDTRTKLPSLETARPATVSTRPVDTMPMTTSVRAASPPSKKRPLATAKKKPVRIAKLATEPPAVLAPIDDQQLRLKTWMASTRRLLESVLELKRRLDRPELDQIDPARFQSIDPILTALRRELDALEPCFALDRNLQAKCVAMLAKLSDLYQSTQHRRSPPKANADAEISPQRQRRAAQSPPKLHPLAIADAEVAIRGPDGKQIFFRARKKSPKRIAFDSSDEEGEEAGEPAPLERSAVPATIDCRPEVESASDDEDDALSSGTTHPRMAQFLRERWADVLVFRVARVDGRAVLLRLHESDELRQLVVELYRPLTSTAITVDIPLDWLAFVLPPTVAWYRVSEVRRYKAVEAHWSRCFDHVARCLKWKPSSEAIEVQFPIQFRQARMFTFRSFAVFHGLLSVRVVPPDYALKITFLNARTHHQASLTLTEQAIVRCLSRGEPYRERLLGTPTRKTLCTQVCDKLYFEYTSRGFEMLFPGIRPKGAPRRHPQELGVVQHRADQLELECKTLKTLLDVCIQQTVAIARRRLESYLDRVRLAKKAKQEATAKKIQARTRSLVAKRKVRRERDELRRTSKLQELAAVLIQREFRRRHEASRQRRALQKLQHDARGVRFRVSARMCGSRTFVLANVALDEIDAAANAFDCVVRVVHPSTSQAAQLRVSHADVLCRLETRSLAGRPRSEIVCALVCEHLEVFRSARRGVLVLALRGDS